MLDIEAALVYGDERVTKQHMIDTAYMNYGPPEDPNAFAKFI